jgi:hypothetical protein
LTRNALKTKPLTFNTVSSALDYINTKLMLGVERFKKESVLLHERQATITKFLTP